MKQAILVAVTYKIVFITSIKGKKMSNKKKVAFAAMMLGLISMAGNASATEGGGGIYPNGNESAVVGAMPPPGFYMLAYVGNYTANNFRDNSGNKYGFTFNLRVTSVAPRAIWVTDQTLLGGQLAFHTIVPLLTTSTLHTGIKATSDSASGLGDITIGAGLGYHASDKFHYTFGVDINAPTGSYDKNKVANLGRNYWNLEPVVALTYVQPEGINANLKAMYDFNRTNGATSYKSGQELHADYDLGWGFGNGLVAGVGGYFYQQTTDDVNNGATVANNRGKAMAIGPSITFNNGKGLLISAKIQRESSVVNRPQGQAFKLKATIPF